MTEAGADSLLIYGLTAMVAHLLMSLGQTLFHQYLGHSRLGGRFFKNHIQFHHANYAGDHVVSTHYLDNGENNTLFFLFPVFLDCRTELFVSEIGFACGSVYGNVTVNLRALLSRQPISCCRIMAGPLFLVQTKTATPFHPPPLWELQFRGDRFLLGSAARHLSPCRIWRMHYEIRCVTATSFNRNLTLRRRANPGCQDAIDACPLDPRQRAISTGQRSTVAKQIGRGRKPSAEVGPNRNQRKPPQQM